MPEICGSCEAEIIWTVTEKGKRMPVDRAPRADGNVKLEHRPGRPPLARVVGKGNGTHTSHFATCPNAGSHRTRR